MQIRVEFSITDDISPHLAEVIRNLADTRPLMNAVGLEMEAMAKETFDDPSLRPIPWPPRKNRAGLSAAGRWGSPLKKSGLLWQSIRVIGVTPDSATVGTDRPYGIFQFAGTRPYRIMPKAKKALAWPGAKHPAKSVNHPGLPPRPFLPVHPQSGEIVPAAARRLQDVIIDWIETQINGR